MANMTMTWLFVGAQGAAETFEATPKNPMLQESDEKPVFWRCTKRLAHQLIFINMILDNIVLDYTKVIFDIFPVLQSLKYNSSLIIENKNLCMNEVQDGFLAQNQCCVLAFCVN